MQRILDLKKKGSSLLNIIQTKTSSFKDMKMTIIGDNIYDGTESYKIGLTLMNPHN